MNTTDAGLQRLLARLLVDQGALQGFRRHPDSLARDYGLTGSQADALAGLDQTGLDFTARTVRTKREDRLEQRFPLTFRLLRAAGRLDEVLDAYAFATLPVRRPDQSRLLTEAHRFVGFLAGPPLPDLPSYAADLARYELLRLELSVATRSEPREAAGTQPKPATPPPDLDDERVGDAVPLLPPSVRTGSYGYDVAALADQLLAGPCVPDPPVAPTCLVLTEAAHESSYLSYRVPPVVLEVLSRCDGTATVREIASMRPALPAAAILRGCLERGVVRLRNFPRL
jgi:hypothetical protein